MMNGSAQIRPGLVYALTLGRGGSKGLPGKNTRLLGGQPLIAWSVAAGKCASLVDRVLCSTDDADIARAAGRAGAEVPFRRPVELADDRATDLDVFAHCIEWLRAEEGVLPELFVQLRPTTPFRGEGWIDDAVAQMNAIGDATSIRSVAPSPLSPFKMWKSSEGGRLMPAMEVEGLVEAYNMPRQSLPEVLWHTGQLDVIRTETLLKGSMTGRYIQEYRVPEAMATDIDGPADFKVAEFQFDSLMPDRYKDYLSGLVADKTEKVLPQDFL